MGKTKFSQQDLIKYPKCSVCEQIIDRKILTIIDGDCWRCNRPMKIASISSSNGQMVRGSSNISPADFTQDEIRISESKGVILKEHYSNTMQCYYIANTCQSCGTFIGEHYLFTEYIAPASWGNMHSECFDIGNNYNCDWCYLHIEENIDWKNLNQTETAKKMFIHLYELTKIKGETTLNNFATDILKVF
ncbi:MAG: hypothetical protein FWG85_02590 [Bacteroidetes bacterium]|nr:hypothetical protein [Bacteroidota bacterium]